MNICVELMKQEESGSFQSKLLQLLTLGRLFHGTFRLRCHWPVLGADFKLISPFGLLSMKISVELMKQEESGSFQSKLLQLLDPHSSCFFNSIG